MSDDFDEMLGNRNFEAMRRFDLISEKTEIDEENQIATLSLKPHPERYRRIDGHVPNLYLDIYLNEAIPFDELMSGAPGLPLFASERVIDSTDDYAQLRREALQAEFVTGEHRPPSSIAKMPLAIQPTTEERRLAFISIDIVGSTSLRQSEPDKFDRSFVFLVREIGNLAAVFGARILKSTGDGLIIYIDHPSFNVQTDTADDLALSILSFLESSLRPALVETGLIGFDLRVGADYGPAKITELLIPATGFRQIDIASDALNRAVKIEQSAKPNEVRIGWHLYRLSHVQWLKKAREIEGEIKGLINYRVFSLG